MFQCQCKNGAQGRNRTTDTAIFSRMLYQLSYLGAPETRANGLADARSRFNPALVAACAGHAGAVTGN